MKYFIFTLTMFLFLIFPLAKQAQAQTRAYNLSLAFSSAEVSINDPNCGFDPRVCILTIEGKGMGIPLGKVTYSTQLTSHWDRATPNGRNGFCAPTEGDVVISNKFGDINANFLGKVCDITFQSEKLPHVYDGQFNITSGTGRYSAATGTGFLKGWDTKSRIVFTVKGSISY